MQYEPYYKIGLPSSIHFRSQIIFGLLLVLFLSFSVSGVYAGVKTGRLEEAIVKPLKNFIEEILKQDYAKPQTEEHPSFNATSSSNVNIENNSRQNSSNRSYSIPSTPYAYPTIQYKSYEEIKKEQDEWWVGVQEQNKKLSEESRKSLEEFRADSQRKLESFKKEGQQGFEQFQQESERKMEEFKQKYGL